MVSQALTACDMYLRDNFRVVKPFRIRSRLRPPSLIDHTSVKARQLTGGCQWDDAHGSV